MAEAPEQAKGMWVPQAGQEAWGFPELSPRSGRSTISLLLWSSASLVLLAAWLTSLHFTFPSPVLGDDYPSAINSHSLFIQSPVVRQGPWPNLSADEAVQGGPGFQAKVKNWSVCQGVCWWEASSRKEGGRCHLKIDVKNHCWISCFSARPGLPTELWQKKCYSFLSLLCTSTQPPQQGQSVDALKTLLWLWKCF